MKITRFEDIEAWTEARVLVSMIYEATGKEPFNRDWGLKNQIQRAVISVMSNIAEGFMSQTNREFIVFLGYSLRSTAEVQSQLYAARDLHYLDDNTFSLLMEKSTRVAKLLQGFIRYLKSTTKPSTNKSCMCLAEAKKPQRITTRLTQKLALSENPSVLSPRRAQRTRSFKTAPSLRVLRVLCGKTCGYSDNTRIFRLCPEILWKSV